MDDRDGAETPQGHPLGIFDSLRGLLATLVGIAHTRVELLGAEFEEQIARLTSILVWTIVTLFLLFTTVILAAMAVLVVFWDSNRILAAIVLAAGFGVLALISWYRVRVAALERPRLFQATIEELAKDRDRLGER